MVTISVNEVCLDLREGHNKRATVLKVNKNSVRVRFGNDACVIQRLLHV